MGTQGQHRTGAVALAGLTLVAAGMAVGTVAPAIAEETTPAAEQTQPKTQPEARPKTEPKPVQDTTPPQRPTLGEATMEAGGTVRLAVQAESGSAVVVREGTEVVASTSASGTSETLSWRTTTGLHTYLVVATDAAGNVSDPAPVDLRVDATPPAAKGFRVTPGNDRDSLSAWRVVTQPGTAYTLLVDGNTVAEGTAEFRTYQQDLDLADGTHEVRLELRDQVGNLRVLEDTVTVDIPALWVAAKAVSGPADTQQVFKIAAPPMTRGFLRIPGVANERFELTDGRAEITLEVPEGSYEAPIVVVADSRDRKGTVELAPFEVDLTAPVLEVSAEAAAAERGVFSATITAGDGDTVRWSLVDDRGLVSLSGEYVADGTAQRLDRNVAEGSYALEVTAVDANGNETVETVDSAVAADPLVNPDAVPALTITLVLWVLVGIAVLLRRRRAQVRALTGRVLSALRPGAKRAQLAAERERAIAEYAAELAAFEQEDAAWQVRRDALAGLVAAAQGVRVDRPGGAKPKERVLCTVPARLVEQEVREDVQVAFETAAGELIVTDTRIAFVGEQDHRVQQRDWQLADLEGLRHIGSNRTLLQIEGEPLSFGVAYADAEVTRLYLELARALQLGTARSMLMMLVQGLRSHELRRPQAPAPVDGATTTTASRRSTTHETAAVVPSQTTEPGGTDEPTELEPGVIVVGQADAARRSSERELALSRS